MLRPYQPLEAPGGKVGENADCIKCERGSYFENVPQKTPITDGSLSILPAEKDKHRTHSGKCRGQERDLSSCSSLPFPWLQGIRFQAGTLMEQDVVAVGDLMSSMTEQLG